MSRFRLRGFVLAFAALCPFTTSAQGGNPPSGPLPDEEGALLETVAEMEACSELSPEMARLYANWLGEVDAHGAKAAVDDVRRDARFAPVKLQFKQRWATAGSADEAAAHEALVDYCRQELTFWERWRHH